MISPQNIPTDSTAGNVAVAETVAAVSAKKTDTADVVSRPVRRVSEDSGQYSPRDIVTSHNDTLRVTVDTILHHPVSKSVKTKTIAVQTPPPPPPWQDGLEPEPRPGHAGHDQGVVAIIVLLMLGMSVSFNNIKRIWGHLTKRLWSTRVREGYEDSATGAEKRTIGLLLLQAVIFIAVLGTAGLSLLWPDVFSNTLTTTLKIGGLVAAYFVFQYVAYNVVGYTFTTDDNRKLWTEGFTAAMTLLGITLMIPGLAVLFYPSIALQAVWVAVGLYVLARIMFISKGFRIFYTNFGSIIYFILYLCTLEIIPIAILLFCARIVCSAGF